MIGLVVAVHLAQRLRQAVPCGVEVRIAVQRLAVVGLPQGGIVDLGAAIDLREPEERPAVGRRVVDPSLDHGPGSAEPIGLQVNSCQGLIDAGVRLRRAVEKRRQGRLRLGELAQTRSPDRLNPVKILAGIAERAGLVELDASPRGNRPGPARARP